MAKTGKEALKELKDYYHSPRDVELLSIIERDLDTLDGLMADKNVSNSKIDCNKCVEQFGYDIPCGGANRTCPYKK